jgi:hypothetical protein
MCGRRSPETVADPLCGAAVEEIESNLADGAYSDTLPVLEDEALRAVAVEIGPRPTHVQAVLRTARATLHRYRGYAEWVNTHGQVNENMYKAKAAELRDALGAARVLLGDMLAAVDTEQVNGPRWYE